MRRLSTASVDIPAHAVHRLTAQSFAVQSDTASYTVQFAQSTPSCECIDWDIHYLPCKHMLAVLSLYGWSLLPVQYSYFMLFVLDEVVVGPLPSDDGDGDDDVTHSSADVHAAGQSLVCDAAADAVPEASEVSAHLMVPADQGESHASDAAAADAVPEASEVSADQGESHASDAAAADAVPEASEVSADLMVPADQAHNTDSASLTTAKLQSDIRQCLAQMSSFTYSIDDSDFLGSMLLLLKKHVQEYRQKAHVAHFPQQYRRRIGKKNGYGSSLQRRLQAARRRKQNKKKVRRTKSQYGMVCRTNYSIFQKTKPLNFHNNCLKS